MYRRSTSVEEFVQTVADTRLTSLTMERFKVATHTATSVTYVVSMAVMKKILGVFRCNHYMFGPTEL